MGFKEIQRDVDEWTSHFDPQYWDPHEIIARLAEETGEIAREVNAEHGPKPKKDDGDGKIGREIADAVFALVCLANRKGIDLDDAWTSMLDDTFERDKERFDPADHQTL